MLITWTAERDVGGNPKGVGGLCVVVDDVQCCQQRRQHNSLIAIPNTWSMFRTWMVERDVKFNFGVRFVCAGYVQCHQQCNTTD